VYTSTHLYMCIDSIYTYCLYVRVCIYTIYSHTHTQMDSRQQVWNICMCTECMQERNLKYIRICAYTPSKHIYIYICKYKHINIYISMCKIHTHICMYIYIYIVHIHYLNTHVYTDGWKKKSIRSQAPTTTWPGRCV